MLLFSDKSDALTLQILTIEARFWFRYYKRSEAALQFLIKGAAYAPCISITGT